MNKKIIALIMAAAMTVPSAAVFAENTEVTSTKATAVAKTEGSAKSEATTMFMATVVSVQKDSVTVKVEGDTGLDEQPIKYVEVTYKINEKTPIVDANAKAVELKEGDQVIVFSDQEVLTKDIKEAKAIVRDNDSTQDNILIDKFKVENGKLTNSDGSLILNVENPEEYDGKEILLFTQFETASLPAQTNPIAMIILDSDGINMIPSRPYESKATSMFTGKVVSVQEDSVTVKVEGDMGMDEEPIDSVDVTYKISEKTPIVNMNAEVVELKAGDQVTVFSDQEVLTKDIKEAKAIVLENTSNNDVLMDEYTMIDGNLTNSDRCIVLNFEKKEDAEKYANKELLVFAKLEDLSDAKVATANEPKKISPVAVIVIGDTEKETESEKECSIGFRVGDSTLKINDKDVTVETPYVVGSGVTLVPVRVISEAFGADVQWDADTKTAIIKFGDKVAAIQIDNKTAQFDSKATELEEAAELTESGVTMVPLRAISEFFGANVGWDGATSSITVSLGK